MSQADYSRQGCKHLCFVQTGSIAAVGYVCCSYVWVREKEEVKKKESKQINVSALCLSRLLSLGGECQVGPP